MAGLRKYGCLLIVLLLGVRWSYSQNQGEVDSLMKIVNTTPSDSLRAEVYLALSTITLNSNPLLSKYYTDKAMKYMPPKNESFLSAVLLAKASVYRNMGLLDSGISLTNRALALATRNNNKFVLWKCYFELGLISQTQSHFDMALEFYAKCLSIQKLMKFDENIPGTLNNIGIVYGSKEEWPTALVYFRKALEADLQSNHLNSLGNDFNNVGVVFIINKQYDSAIAYLNKGMEYRRRNNDLLGIGGSYNNMALLHMKLNDPKKGLAFADSALQLAEKIKSKKLELEVYGTYHEIYEYTGDYKNALRAYTRVNELQKELTKESNQQKVDQMQKSMELEMKQKELLEKDLALMRSEKEQEKKNNLILVFVIGTLALIGFLFYIFRINDKLKSVNKIISEQKSLIQEKHKDITDSIQYAQKIQNAIILSDKALQGKVKDIFVLFRPRDIVSGDFYWYTEKNNLRLLAVADCTGHGVPGAFMSMIGITMLNQIVNEKGITSPAEILNRLREGVIGSLNQTGEEDGKRDGMDVALIAWTDYSLVYAGANNPCLVLRNNEFIELKPDKQPVGLYEKQEPFREQKLFLEKNDEIYLFTDGITDQFGGEKGKKVKMKGLKDWLLSLSGKPPEEKRKELEAQLERWKGRQAQTDDILIIGLRC